MAKGKFQDIIGRDIFGGNPTIRNKAKDLMNHWKGFEWNGSDRKDLDLHGNGLLAIWISESLDEKSELEKNPIKIV